MIQKPLLWVEVGKSACVPWPIPYRGVQILPPGSALVQACAQLQRPKPPVLGYMGPLYCIATLSPKNRRRPAGNTTQCRYMGVLSMCSLPHLLRLHLARLGS